MRSTLEKMSDQELIKLIDELDVELDSAMQHGDDDFDYTWGICQNMDLVIEELRFRGIDGWWNHTKF